MGWAEGNGREAMANTKIFLTFADGEEREYIVSDEAEKRIVSGKPFCIETIHPNFGEIAMIRVGIQLQCQKHK